jgi:hypothetical protein
MTLSILTICFVIYPSVRTRIHTMGNKKNTRGITEFLSSWQADWWCLQKVVLSLCPGPPEFWAWSNRIFDRQKADTLWTAPLLTVLLQKDSGKGVWTKGNKKSSSWSSHPKKILILILIWPVTNQLSHPRAPPPYSRARSSPGSCYSGAKIAAAKVFNRKAFKPHLF